MPRKSPEQGPGTSTVKVRIAATEEKAAQIAADLRDALSRTSGRYVVREVSGFYPNRGDSSLGRIYLDVDVVGAVGGEA